MVGFHDQIVENPQPQEITKTNRKKIENERNKNAKKETLEKLKADILKKKELEEKAKKLAEDESITFYRELEQKKHVLEEEKIEKEKSLLEFQKKCIENTSKNESCCICLELPRNSITVPCGHWFFCHDCIITQFKHQGSCPICRAKITTIVKVYD